MRLRKRAILTKFFADRGTHLAAMVAYFALLSFVPLIFLSLSLLGLVHRADASDFLVRELKRAFPGSSLQSILTLVRRVQANARTLGIIGAVGLLWSSTSLFSSLESAFNIVYGRPNRPFLRGKGIVGALGVEVLKRYAPDFVADPAVAYVVSVALSLLGVFVFLVAVYRLLPNVPLTVRDILPGSVLGAILLEASFQILPIFVRFADVNVTLRVLGGPVILLLWLYVMANVIVFGAEVNWWVARRREVTSSSSSPATASPPARPTERTRPAG